MTSKSITLKETIEKIFFDVEIPEFLELRREYVKNHSNPIHYSEILIRPKTEIFKYPIQNFIKQHQYLTSKGFSHLTPYAQHLGLIGPFYLNTAAFYPTIKMLGTDEQFLKWKKSILDVRIFGAYAQTELGHGSDVQGLETIATFDEFNKCFILESPKLSSIKWWPGLLGIYATHVVLQAKLYVKNKNYGIQTFVIQIRDLNTLKTLPGIEIGDIGPKLGLNFTDNGYLILNKVKVPLDNLLMRYIKVTEDGKVIKSDDENASKLGYASMLNLRTTLLTYFLKDTLCILSLHYDQIIKDKARPKNSMRLYIKNIAYIYSSILVYYKLNKIYADINEALKTNISKALTLIKELHILNSGFKASISWNITNITKNIITEHNQANLYLFGAISSYTDLNPTITYEGDNSVLSQQTAKELLKIIHHVEKGGKIKDSNNFLMNIRDYVVRAKNIQTETFLNPLKTDDPLNPKFIGDTLGLLVYESIKNIRDKIEHEISINADMKKIWNETSQKDLIEVTKLYTNALTYFFAKEIIDANTFQFDQESKNLYEKLICLYGLNLIKENLNKILLYKILNNNDPKLDSWIDEGLSKLYTNLEGKLSIIRESAPFTPNETGNISNLKKYNLTKVETELYKEFSRNARNLMKDFHHYSKL